MVNHTAREGCEPRNLQFGGGREVTIRDLAETIARLSEQKKPVIVEGKLTDYAGRSRYFPDSRAIRDALGVRESLSLDQALSSLLTIATSL